VRDFDRDVTQDLAILNESSNSLSFFAGNGDGTFGDRVDYTAMGIQPYSVVAEDFNGDGFLDLAVSNSALSNILVLAGRGDGTFGPDLYEFDLSAGSGPHIMAVGDFNSDGQSDLAVANSGSNQISILFNNSR
jgi:hypothetical protein